MNRPAFRSALLALPLVAATALPAMAQLGAPTGVTRPSGPEAPSDPAPAPPSAPDLTQPPRAATPPAPLPRIALPPSMHNLPAGGWRITGDSATGKVDAPTTNILAEIGRRLASGTVGRVTVVAQVASPTDDLSLARRASLANALTVRRLLEAGGLPGTRIDIRPLGRTAAAENAIEVLPPGIPSPSLGPQAEQAPPRP